MTIQYNIAVKVLDPRQEGQIQQSLQGYRVFVDRSGNLDGTCFSRETVPYVGDLIVVKTIKKEAASVAHEVLSGLEGLVVLPITTCSQEEDEERVAKILREKHPYAYSKRDPSAEFMVNC